MDGRSPAQQAALVRSWSVIIAPHGAQNSNWAFISPCTVVVELFPYGYYAEGHLHMAMQAGAAAAYRALTSRRSSASNHSQGCGVHAEGRRLSNPFRSTAVRTDARLLYEALPALVAAHARCASRLS